MIDHFKTVMLRDIDTLRREVDLYPDDASLWKNVPGLPNSGGTLVLHLVGNLRHFIGAVLGHTSYVRNRDMEFSARGVSRADLVQLILATREEVAETFADLDRSVLEAPFPVSLGGQTHTTDRMLLHLAVHLTYHTGQLDYHRRVVTGSSASAGALSPP